MAPLAMQDEFYVPDALTKDKELEENESKKHRKGSHGEVEASTSQSDKTSPKTCDKVDEKDGKPEQTEDRPEITDAKSSKPCDMPEVPSDKCEENEDGNGSESGKMKPSLNVELSAGDAIQRSSSRSTSVASSFKTAFEVPVVATCNKDLNDSKTTENFPIKISPEDVQDSGISSTSNTRATSQGTSSSRNLSCSPVSDVTSSSVMDSSSMMSSSDISMESSSSVGSRCTESSFSEVSSIAESSTTEISLEYSTEVSQDLHDLSSDTDTGICKSQTEKELQNDDKTTTQESK